MSRNGMPKKCTCLQLDTAAATPDSLKLLSAIPNQKVYRCCSCHAFLAYSENTREWEVLLEPDVESEIKQLYQAESS